MSFFWEVLLPRILEMAQTTVHSVSETSYFKNSDPVSFFVVLFQAVMYIASNGELRVNPDCKQSRNGGPDGMRRLCETMDDGKKLCLYAAASGKHFLAMDPKTGMLTASRITQDKPKTSPGQEDLCLWFEEQSVPNTPVFTKRIIGCPSSTRHELSFDGSIISVPSICSSTASRRPFSQRRSTQNKTTSSRLSQVQVGPARPRICTDTTIIKSTCPGALRESYPLNWMACSPS
eukprot:scpid92854/ scgid4509/ 